MRVTVVYESLFGNTRMLAEAIAEGIRAAQPGADVSCVAVAEAGPQAAETDLLVIGGPTHFLGMTSRRSRRMARQYLVRAGAGELPHPAEPPAGPGVREWLAALPPAGGRPAAAFDTRLDTLFPGSAARLIGRTLRDHGYRIIAAPEGFTVTAMVGPLSPGERDRARAWGAGLWVSLSHSGPPPSGWVSERRPGRRARSVLWGRFSQGEFCGQPEGGGVGLIAQCRRGGPAGARRVMGSPIRLQPRGSGCAAGGTR